MSNMSSKLLPYIIFNVVALFRSWMFRKHGWIVRVRKFIDTVKEETSSGTHRSAFTLIFTDLVTCCFYEASVCSLVKVI